MLTTRGYAAKGPTSKLEPFQFERRDPGSDDILIEILFCGVCHSDIHQARGEWGNSTYPMVPGHEIVGRVTRAGSKVTRFKAGDLAAVGCFVDSCRTCGNCKDEVEQFCEKHTAFTYNGTEMDLKTPTQGGYSSQIVVDDKYALRIPANLPLPNTAPLLCAGITTYSPLKRFKIGRNDRVAVVGLGGLGHMGVKLAASMGAEVTVISTSSAKEKDAKRLGAHEFVDSTNRSAVRPLANRFHFILDCVSAAHDIDAYLNMLKRDGTMTIVGAPPKPLAVSAFSLILGRRSLTGGMIGGIRETQEMLDYCGEKNITSDVEVVPIQDVETAYERTIKGDVRYRFVIDMKTL